MDTPPHQKITQMMGLGIIIIVVIPELLALIQGEQQSRGVIPFLRGGTGVMSVLEVKVVNKKVSDGSAETKAE